MKRRLTIIATAGLILGLAIASGGYRPAQAEDAQWTAQYYNNKTLAGTPKVTQLEDKIDYRWGTSSPFPGTIPKDVFSVRWTRVVHFDAGTFVFRTRSDDGIRVWIDNKKVIDQWNDHPMQTYELPYDLDEGDHTLKVEYYENKGLATVAFYWAPLKDNPWNAQYFNGVTLGGSIIQEREENQISNFWGGASPAQGVTARNFSVRWTRTQPFVTGDYRFTVTVSDGFRLYVGNTLVLDKWYDHGVETHSAKVHINTGNRTVRLEFYNHSYPAVIRLRIRPA